jgi:hypothetical protein
MYCTSSRTNRSQFLGFLNRNGLRYVLEDTPSMSRFVVNCDDIDDFIACRDEAEEITTDWVCF